VVDLSFLEIELSFVWVSFEPFQPMELCIVECVQRSNQGSCSRGMGWTMDLL
jgi:hypothetical protein